MTNYYEGKIFRTEDGKFYTNDLDGSGFTEITSGTYDPGYLEYVALIYQDEAHVLTVTEFNNTIGTITWTHSATGILNGALPTEVDYRGHSLCFATPNDVGLFTSLAMTTTSAGYDDNLVLYTYSGLLGNSDLVDFVGSIAVMIRLYPAL